jgi:hypothetical protein
MQSILPRGGSHRLHVTVFIDTLLCLQFVGAAAGCAGQLSAALRWIIMYSDAAKKAGSALLTAQFDTVGDSMMEQQQAGVI